MLINVVSFHQEEPMSVTDDLLRNSEAYAATFDKGDLPLPPARKIAVLACMDARLNPYGLLGLSEGDAHVIRNAGGVVTDDEIHSLVWFLRPVRVRKFTSTTTNRSSAHRRSGANSSSLKPPKPNSRSPGPS
jgi:carbonic anhydrase